MGDLPLSYISAFKAPPDAPASTTGSAANSPTSRRSTCRPPSRRCRACSTRSIHAVELLFGFALVAGLVVLVAAVSATREARAREFAVMRAVGA